MNALITMDPSGFACIVSLKGIIHHLYEYEMVNSNIIMKIKDLARKRGFEIPDEKMRIERRKWRAEFKKLRNWSTIRNTATGHYDKNIQAQFRALESIDPEQVMDVMVAFFSCNMELLKMLHDVGQGNIG